MTSKSATPTDPVHSGEGVPGPLGLSAAEIVRRIGVPANRVTEIVAGRRGITGDTALRLGGALGTNAEFWMNLQKGWELAVARDRRRGA